MNSLLAVSASGLLFLTAALRPALADVVRDPQIGVCTHFAFKGDGWPVQTMVPLIAQTGAGWIRDDLTWASVERSPGVYQIPQRAMNWIDAVSAAGIKIDLIFNYGNKIYPDPYDPNAYAKAAAWTAAQLHGKIAAIEILNEPANFGFSKHYDGEQAWSGLKSDGTVATYIGKYVTLLNTAAKAIRAANPDIKIIGLGCSAGANFRALAMGIDPEVDGLTDHPYSAHSIPELVPFAATSHALRRDGIVTADEQGTFASQIRLYRSQAATYKGPKEIWLTEQGWPTFQSMLPFRPFTPVTEQTQAKYILRRLAESLGLGVDVTFIYDLRDDGPLPDNPEHHFGLLDTQSRPKLAAHALQRFCAAMADFHAAHDFDVVIAPGAPITSSYFWGTGLAGTDALRSYQFVDSKNNPLLALWTTNPVSADAPIDATVKITTIAPITGVSAYLPLTDERTNIPFEQSSGCLILKNFFLSDSPALLTFKFASELH